MEELKVYLADKNLCENAVNVMEFNQLVCLAKNVDFIKYVFRYKVVRIYCKHFWDLPAPFLSLCV